MAVRLLLLALALGACGALQVGGAAGTTTIPRAAPRSAAPATMMAPRAPWETAQIPLAVVSMNPFQNLKQMGDQRVAKVSHIVLAPGQCPLPLNEALELLEQWKQEIGDDAEKFAERAKSDSQCPTAATGGALGFFPRTWILPEDGLALERRLASGRHRVIVKPDGGSQGDGIFVADSWSDVRLRAPYGKAALVAQVTDL